MKIDPTQTHDLLERMRSAAQSAATPSGASAGAARSPADAVGAATPDVSPLESNLREIAQRALDGAYADASQLRGDVVQQIVRDRWQGQIRPEKVEELVDELSRTLVDDPEFSRTVDEMLVLAARHVSTP